MRRYGTLGRLLSDQDVRNLYYISLACLITLYHPLESDIREVKINMNNMAKRSSNIFD